MTYHKWSLLPTSLSSPHDPLRQHHLLRCVPAQCVCCVALRCVACVVAWDHPSRMPLVTTFTIRYCFTTLSPSSMNTPQPIKWHYNSFTLLALTPLFSFPLPFPFSPLPCFPLTYYIRCTLIAIQRPTGFQLTRKMASTPPPHFSAAKPGETTVGMKMRCGRGKEGRRL